jgi:hypothetical protein
MKKENIKKIIYDHWVAFLPILLPSIGLFLLTWWDYSKELLSYSIPFFIVFILLIVLGTFISLTIKYKKEIKRLEAIPEIILSDDNLIYKKNEKQPYCPVCYQNEKELRYMRKDERGDCIYCECFFCEHREEIKIKSEEDIDIKDIPF